MKKGLIITLVIVIALILCGVVGFIIYTNMNTGSSGGLLDTSGGSSAQGLSFEQNEEQEYQFEKGIAMPGWEYMEIEANTPDIVVDLYNPEENKGYYYLTFELILDETGESLYKSGLVKAGDHVRNITLSRGLAPGTYRATLKIKSYTADEALKQKNGGSVSFDLRVVEV